MELSHKSCSVSKSKSAMNRLQDFIAARRSSHQAVEDVEGFERQLHKLFAEAECEVLAEEMSRLDVDIPVVYIEGVAHHRVLHCEQTYMSTSGPMRIARTLYSTRQGGERAVCPLEMRAGIVEDMWTPLAAKQASWVITHMTPQEAQELFVTMGGMRPSKSSLDRLPKKLSERWEGQKTVFEERLRTEERVPVEAVTIGVSLDGVMLPMKDGKREEKRHRAAADGKHVRGPAGHKEAACATVSFYDGEGERLSTIRIARMPETKKKTLKEMIADEVESALKQKPDLKIVKIADGAKDNWEFLSKQFPKGEELVDFYHAAEHLNSALVVAYGETNPKCKAQFEKLRHILLEDPNGVDRIIRSLRHLLRHHPRKSKIFTELKYFRNNRKRMLYAEAKARGLPIGSGVVEAACKTLVTQRMKRAGMRWTPKGGQAILTLRSLVQSGRFDLAWSFLAETYKSEVTLPKNVVLFGRRRRC